MDYNEMVLNENQPEKKKKNRILFYIFLSVLVHIFILFIAWLIEIPPFQKDKKQETAVDLEIKPPTELLAETPKGSELNSDATQAGQSGDPAAQAMNEGAGFPPPPPHDGTQNSENKDSVPTSEGGSYSAMNGLNDGGSGSSQSPKEKPNAKSTQAGNGSKKGKGALYLSEQEAKEIVRDIKDKYGKDAASGKQAKGAFPSEELGEGEEAVPLVYMVRKSKPDSEQGPSTESGPTSSQQAADAFSDQGNPKTSLTPKSPSLAELQARGGTHPELKRGNQKSGPQKNGTSLVASGKPPGKKSSPNSAALERLKKQHAKELAQERTRAANKAVEKALAQVRAENEKQRQAQNQALAGIQAQLAAQEKAAQKAKADAAKALAEADAAKRAAQVAAQKAAAPKPGYGPRSANTPDSPAYLAEGNRNGDGVEGFDDSSEEGPRGRNPRDSGNGAGGGQLRGHVAVVNPTVSTRPLRPGEAPPGWGQSQYGRGVPSSVRSIGLLRQEWGNPIPQYSIEERLQGMQGNVSLIAFVNDDGSLSHFIKVQSTGHQSLDEKSLNALKRWKFLRGQRGWVEIPLQWSLVGPPEELSSALRRQNRATADKL